VNKILPGTIGLLGGTFNPVHTGHLRLAIEVREALALSRIDFLPAKSPPHKRHDNLLDYRLRMQMVCNATAQVDGLGACAIEGDLPEPSYSLLTIQHLQTHNPNTCYAFILGSSDLLTLPQWYQGLQIPYTVDLIVAGREGLDNSAMFLFLRQHWDYAYLADDVLAITGGRRIFFVSIPRIDISATLIRKKFCQNQEVFGLVPENVRQCMLENKSKIQQCWSVYNHRENV